jgi:hypothetical protein
MEKKLTSDQVKSLLTHVIRTIDRWWVEKTDCKRGYFTRSKCEIPDILYQDYVEWRYSTTKDSKYYGSIFISLDYVDRTNYINIALKRMKNGVYAEYDPFCEIYDGKTEVVISEETGFVPDNIMHDVLTEKDFEVLTDAIANTVHKFMEASSVDEEEVSVNMDDVSKTLSAHDIQDCMIKAARIMIVDRDTVKELMRLRAKYIADAPDLSQTQVKNMLGYAIDVTSKHVVTRIVYGNDNTSVALCSFICEPDTHGPHEFIIRYNSCDTGFCYDQGFNILYKNPDDYCFEYAADGLNVEKVFKPFVNILRNTLNCELYQSLPQFQDTAITAPAGLKTKEIFVLDTSYFVIGDIYLLEISPTYDWSKISTTPIKAPRWVYAICEDVCSTVIDFMIGGIEGRDDLLGIPVHADEIEDGLVTVKRVLMNETLIQEADEE